MNKFINIRPTLLSMVYMNKFCSELNCCTNFLGNLTAPGTRLTLGLALGDLLAHQTHLPPFFAAPRLAVPALVLERPRDLEALRRGAMMPQCSACSGRAPLPAANVLPVDTRPDPMRR